MEMYITFLIHLNFTQRGSYQDKPSQIIYLTATPLHQRKYIYGASNLDNQATEFQIQLCRTANILHIIVCVKQIEIPANRTIFMLFRLRIQICQVCDPLFNCIPYPKTKNSNFRNIILLSIE